MKQSNNQNNGQNNGKQKTQNNNGKNTAKNKQNDTTDCDRWASKKATAALTCVPRKICSEAIRASMRRMNSKSPYKMRTICKKQGGIFIPSRFFCTIFVANML